MNIGKLINNFEENTDSSLESFNKIFKMCPIKTNMSKNSYVEIGEITGVGNQFKRYVKINNRTIEHNFYYIDEEFKNIYGNKNKNIKKKGAKKRAYDYVVENNEGKIIARDCDFESLSKKLKVNKIFLQNLQKNKRTQKGMYVYKLFKNQKKRSFKRCKYIIEDNDKILVFYSKYEAADYLEVHYAYITNLINGKNKYKRKNVKVKSETIKAL